MGWQKYIFRIEDPGFLCLDLRSAEEYQRGHIPGSLSVPFPVSHTVTKPSNPRKSIAGRAGMADAAKILALEANLQHPGQRFIIICRDGSFVSAFAHDVLKERHEVYILKGGYRQYRRQVRGILAGDFRYVVLAGKTGTGKTELLQRLGAKGEQVLDLERIAVARGSAFGRIGIVLPQPSQEQFENRIAAVLKAFDPGQLVFVEEETQPIGKCHLPPELSARLAKSPRIILQLPFNVRVNNLIETYAGLDDDELIRGILSLSSRLGEEVAAILEEKVRLKQYAAVAERLLEYYDQAAGYAIKPRESDINIDAPDEETLLEKLIISKKKRLIVHEGALASSDI